MPEYLTRAQVEELKTACGQAEIVISGELWTRFAGLQEWKVSPHGEAGDFDTDCYFVDFAEVRAYET